MGRWLGVLLLTIYGGDRWDLPPYRNSYWHGISRQYLPTLMCHMLCDTCYKYCFRFYIFTIFSFLTLVFCFKPFSSFCWTSTPSKKLFSDSYSLKKYFLDPITHKSFFFSIGAPIRIGQESHCLIFFFYKLL